jgi:hypothetical protein
MKRPSLQQRLGADQAVGTIHLVLFIPTVDRQGRKLRGRSWTRKALETLGKLFRGATAYPQGLGVWRDDAAGGKLVFDDTTLVFSYIAPKDLTPGALSELRRFLHRMGREANQGEVGLVIDGRYLGISRFDP